MHNAVIEFWFNEIDTSKWFVKDLNFDEEIRLRFGELHTQAKHCELSAWRTNALGCLAEVIVLDQFSRNIYRDQAQAFENDSLALALAQQAISLGFDAELNAQQKSFLYMPFMHSESLAIHQEAVRLFTQLGVKDNLDFELKHQIIIERFGRYPHRNALLNRKSTPEEKLFLEQPGSSF